MASTSNIIACIWDFDKVFIPNDFLQLLIHKFELGGTSFEEELIALAQIYAERGLQLTPSSIFLNHLISYAQKDAVKNFNAQTLKEIGEAVEFYPGVLKLLDEIKGIASGHPEFFQHKIIINHYIVTQGLAEIVRNTSIAYLMSGIYGSELIDVVLPPSFQSKGFALNGMPTYKALGEVLDPFKKTAIMQKISLGINNKSQNEFHQDHKTISNTKPWLKNLVYIGNGFQSIPSFDWVRKNFGKSFSVYNPSVPQQFEEGDLLLRNNKVDAYGPADYTSSSNTSLWLKMHIRKMCEEIVSGSVTVNT